MQKRPMEKCVGCNERLENIGGRRVIRSSKGGIVLCTAYESFYLAGMSTFPAFFYRLKDDPRILVTWGNFVKDLYSIKTNLELAEYKMKEEKEVPWVCQKCIEYALCSKCGEPLVDAPGTTVLKDDGSKKHSPVLGARRPCSNPECERSK